MDKKEDFIEAIYIIYMIGLDVGSSAAKMVRFENGKLQEYHILKTPKWKELLEYIGNKEVIYSTGYFRKIVPHKESITEITAATFGAKHYFEEVEVIVDIGGQDTKVIDVINHKFNINDKCSAGTGAFLEFVAKYFGISLSDLGKLHYKAKNITEINNTCGVFAISEMISKLVEGYSREDVIAGMHYAFARRISYMIPDADCIMVIGGTVKNKGIVSALEDILKKDLLIPEEPQIINAIGAVKYHEEGREVML